MPNKHRHKKAFTLIEILLAMTITSIIILAINGAYKQGAMMWDRVEDDAQVYHHINTLAEMLRTEIGSIYIPNKQGNSREPDEGKKEKDIFSLTSSGLSFYTSNPSNGTSPRYAKFSKVSYASTGEKLTRVELLAAGAKTIEAPSDEDNKISHDSSFDIPKVRFEACVIDQEAKKYVWKSEFKSKDSLPKAIAIYFQKTETKHTQSFEAKLIIGCVK